MRRIRVLAATSFAVLALVLAGCATGTADAGTAGSAASGAPEEEISGEVTVYAAASLGEVFDELAAAFEARFPSVEVLPIVYDGSSTLATQLIEGAPADVFASADEANMQKVVDAGLAAEPALFATNTLVIAVPAGDPGGVASLADLADPGLTVVLCAPEVPCGAASATLLAAQGVDVTPASMEQNVTAVLTKVAAGEADAGLVYATDIARADGVEAVEAEGADAVVNRYPISVLSGAADPAAAAAFVAFVTGPEGQALLARNGFGAP